MRLILVWNSKKEKPPINKLSTRQLRAYIFFHLVRVYTLSRAIVASEMNAEEM
jgi:hypothetical protein